MKRAKRKKKRNARWQVRSFVCLVRFPKAVSRPNAYRSGWTAPDYTEPIDHAVTNYGLELREACPKGHT
jgi:hypothetical protein